MVIKRFCCPMCNAGCGLIAEVENNKVISIKPDQEYPLNNGYCCPKGIALEAVTNDKDRIKRPLKRVDGEFVEISWKKALHEIADKLKKYHPQSISYYLGTNSVHQYAHSMFAVGFMDAIGSRHMYNAGSVDNNNNFVAQNYMYGSSVVMPIPDLANTDLIYLIGTNPAVSNMSLVTCANVMGVLKSVKERGGEVYVIDPRRNETARILTKKDDGYYISIFPDTDIYLLLAMINIIFKENLEDKNYIRENTVGINKLRELVDPFTPELAEKICDIPVNTIFDLTRKFVRTKKAVMYARLGTCLSTFATLNAWAVAVINVISGKLDTPGGLIFGKNIINIPKLGKIVGMGAMDEFRSRIGNYPDVMGAFPLGVLAKEILHEKNPVKVLLLSGGNPALSAPNSNEFRKALEKLEFCVVLDFYINETSMIAADYILPTRSPLENSNSPIYLLNYQVFPHVDYSHALVAPERYGPKPEWEILLALSRLMKVPMFGSAFLNFIPKIFQFLHKEYTPEFFLKLFLFLGQILEKKIPHLSTGTFSIKKLKKTNTIVLGKNKFGVLKDYLRTKDKKVHLINDNLESLIKSCRSYYDEKLKFVKDIKAEDTAFAMIGRRNLKSMNSWMHNVERLWRNKQEPRLFINPKDAQKLNISNEELVIVENPLGTLKLPIKITDEVIPNVLCYPHGWGHKNPKLSFANQHAGENINMLTNSAVLDSLSGQPLLNGYRVELRKV